MRRRGNQQWEPPTKVRTPLPSRARQLRLQPLGTSPGQGDPAGAALLLLLSARSLPDGGVGVGPRGAGIPIKLGATVLCGHVFSQKLGVCVESWTADTRTEPPARFQGAPGDKEALPARHRDTAPSPWSSPPRQPAASPWADVHLCVCVRFSFFHLIPFSPSLRRALSTPT